MLLEILGKELIVETAKAVVSTLTDVQDHEDPYVNQIIEELDIDNKIKIISSLIDKQSYIYKDITFHDKHRYNAIYLCIKNLSQIIHKIKKELDTIHELLATHKEKWFHTWRAGKYYKNLEYLKAHDKILDKRLQLFLNIMKTIHLSPPRR